MVTLTEECPASRETEWTGTPTEIRLVQKECLSMWGVTRLAISRRSPIVSARANRRVVAFRVGRWNFSSSAKSLGRGNCLVVNSIS